MNKTEMKKVIVGCEPTGCYWLTFQKFLQDHDIQLVTVNPFTVNRSMELDDNSPEKSDLKVPKTIALLVKDGRFSTSYLPSGVYAEIREASVCRDQIMKQHVRLSNQIQGWLQKFFPEYFEGYADWAVIVNKKVPKMSEKIPHLFYRERHPYRCHIPFYYVFS